MAKLYAISFGEKDKFHRLDLTDGRGSVEWTTVTTTAGGSAGDSHKIVAAGVGVGVSLGVLSAVMLGAGFLWGRRKTRAKYEGSPVQKPVTAPEGQMMLAAPQLHGSNPIYEASNSQIEISSKLPMPEVK